MLQSIGAVKLQFSDEHNNKFIVSRSMEARLLKSKIEFKGTDGTISTIQPDGSVSLSDLVVLVILVVSMNFTLTFLLQLKSHKNKNNDLNSFISNTLGVSKALLNNVLFCHQEDSNWFVELIL